MNILPIIYSFLQIVDLIFKIKDKFVSKLDADKTSLFLRMVGELLLEVSNEIEHGRYPHNKCQEMWHYMNEMKDKLKSILSADQLITLQNEIENCYRVEQLCGQVNQLSPEEKVENIKTLRAAAGSFVAVSNLIKL